MRYQALPIITRRPIPGGQQGFYGPIGPFPLDDSFGDGTLRPIVFDWDDPADRLRLARWFWRTASVVCNIDCNFQFDVIGGSGSPPSYGHVTVDVHTSSIAGFTWNLGTIPEDMDTYISQGWSDGSGPLPTNEQELKLCTSGRAFVDPYYTSIPIASDTGTTPPITWTGDPSLTRLIGSIQWQLLVQEDWLESGGIRPIIIIQFQVIVGPDNGGGGWAAHQLLSSNGPTVSYGDQTVISQPGSFFGQSVNLYGLHGHDAGTGDLTLGLTIDQKGSWGYNGLYNLSTGALTGPWTSRQS